MNKILIIGQALPAVEQTYPYDTTLLYEMLSWVGISKEAAQDIFIFDAVYNGFPGFDSKGGHLKPSLKQMQDYWKDSLKLKVEISKRIWLLGNVAKNFFYAQSFKQRLGTVIIETPHPSKRNYSLIMNNKEQITNLLNKIISHERPIP